VWLRCGSATTLIVLRHADRPSTGQDVLTPEGAARAQELVHLCQKAGVVAVYGSETNRARDTAAPLAAALGLTPEVYAPKDVSGVVSRIFADHRGRTVVVVGHSNTVPLIIEAAGGPKVPDLADDEFDNVFVLTVGPRRFGRASLVQLQYGAASP
jgi:broad specificity phosphatase PhoE